MSQHISQQDLQKYLSRTLRPDELVIFDVHLTKCDRCLQKTADLRLLQHTTESLHDTLLTDVEIDGHLSYEQFVSYVDGEIGEIDKEIVEVHKGVCRDCAEQLEELLQLRATLQLENEPAKTLTAPTEGFSLSRLWTGITPGSFLKFTAPATAALLLGVIIWAAWYLTKTPPSEIAQVVEPAANKPSLETMPESIVNGSNNAESGLVNSAPHGQNNSNSNLPQPIISLADGGTRIELDSDGNLKGLNAPQFESRVKSVLTTQNIEISQAARELRLRSGVLMGGEQSGAPFALTAPVGKIVQSDRPQFRWRPLDGADSYVVTIYDANFNQIATSSPLRQTTWRAGSRLKRGIIYQWQVTAVKDGQEIKSPVRPAPEAKFKILDTTKANEIEVAKRNNGSSHLLLGILFANAGLMDEAERELLALLKKNPKSDIVRTLLRKVQGR